MPFSSVTTVGMSLSARSELHVDARSLGSDSLPSATSLAVDKPAEGRTGTAEHWAAMSTKCSRLEPATGLMKKDGTFLALHSSMNCGTSHRVGSNSVMSRPCSDAEASCFALDPATTGATRDPYSVYSPSCSGLTKTFRAPASSSVRTSSLDSSRVTSKKGWNSTLCCFRKRRSFSRDLGVTSKKTHPRQLTSSRLRPSVAPPRPGGTATLIKKGRGSVDSIEVGRISKQL